MRYYKVAMNCGCCTATMAFESEERMRDAIREWKLSVNESVTDDRGVAHEGIDTFFGIVDVTTEVNRAERKARKTPKPRRGRDGRVLRR